MGWSQQLKQVSLPVFVLVMLFSMSTWIDVVGIWVEIPLLVNFLPEGWALPAYLTIIIQCANIGPASYAIVYKIRSGKPSRNGLFTYGSSYIGWDVFISFGIIIIATLSIFFMCFFWNYTVVVAGSLHSIPLFVLVGLTALVSCMSSVIFLPYMARFNAIYISAYYVGQGLSGLVPGFAGLIQGIGQEPICLNSTILNDTGIDNSTVHQLTPFYHPPLFSVGVFFGFIVSLLLISLVAFYFLNFTEFCKKEMVNKHQPAVVLEENNSDSAVLSTDSINQNETIPHPRASNYTTVADTDANDLLSQTEPSEIGLTKGDTEDSNPEEEVRTVEVLMSRFVLMLATIGIINAMTNGILPATQSYTCLPYGNLVYTLSVRLSSVVSPLASLSSMFLPRPSGKTIVFLTVVGVSISLFHLVLAAQSPYPVLKGRPEGESLVIATSVIMAASFSFVRVSVAAILREEGGRRGLLWCGAITQVGSFCGALVTFLLVQIFHLLQSIPPCA